MDALAIVKDIVLAAFAFGSAAVLGVRTLQHARRKEADNGDDPASTTEETRRIIADVLGSWQCHRHEDLARELQEVIVELRALREQLCDLVHRIDRSQADQGGRIGVLEQRVAVLHDRGSRRDD